MTLNPSFRRSDWVCAGLLWAATAAVFGAGASRLGFYYDDAGWLAGLPSAGAHSLWALMTGYIPGRNLFPFWQFLIYSSAQSPASHLTEFHISQSTLDGLAVAVFFCLLRMLSLPADVSIMAAGLFSFWPIHGETHYWLTAIPQNLLSTVFVLTFACTSVALARGVRLWWIWLLDAASFFCGLFTYDQCSIALGLIAGARAGAAMIRRNQSARVLAAMHVAYAAALLFYAKLKLSTAAGAGPALSGQAWSSFPQNALATASDTAGKLWAHHMAELFQKASFADWLLAALAAAALTGLALWRLQEKADAPLWLSPARLLLLAGAFYIAAYIPVWVWYISRRHHLLPSAGLFVGVAAAATVPAGSGRRLWRVLILLLFGGAILAFAAASRGESRYWEESFAVKKELFRELQPDLAGRQALVLTGFPSYLGPAYLISPHDATFAPGLFFGKLSPLDPGFTGSIGAVPAPGGVFIHTLLSIYGANQFLYEPAEKTLVVRYSGWDRGRLRFEKNPPPRLFYEVVPDNSRGDADGGVQIAARREAGQTVVSFQVDARLPPHCYLAAVLSSFHDGGFHRWGVFEKGFGYNVMPVLLSGSQEPPSGGSSGSGEPADARRASSAGRWRGLLRLHDFPEAERLQLEFFKASKDHLPVPLGRAQTAVQP
jgi:hypothetical protein